MTPIFIGPANSTNRSFGNLSSNPSSPVEGDTYFNTATNKLSIYDGSSWITIPAPLGTVGNPASSAAEIIADGQSGDGYYYIKLPSESTATQRWCDLTNGYMLISHWSVNTTGGSGDTNPTPGSTSFATSYGGFSGITNAAVAAPNGSDDEATNQTWVWDADTRGTSSGGSFHRNSGTSSTSVPSQGSKQYIPKHYGYNWRYLKWGMRWSVPSGSSNYNSMDNFSPNTQDINRIYVDGISITHGASATDGSGSGRNHIYTVNVNGTPTQGNNGGSTPSFTSQGNGRNNFSSHTSSTAYGEAKATYDKGSSSDTRIEMRLQSDQDTTNEDIYLRAWYILMK